MTLKQQKAKIYKSAWRHNLILTGVENGEPLFLGNGNDLEKWQKELTN